MNVNQYNQMSGRPLTPDEIKTFQIHSMSLGGLVNNAVFENEFDSKKFIVDETVVASETKKRFPNLYNKNNKLDELALNSFLSNQNLKIDDLVKIIDYEIRANIFDKLFFNISYPNKLNNILNKHNNHSRNIDLINFNINDFKLSNLADLDISIKNNKIIDFFNQNINSYINPEKRDLSYILIDQNNYTNQFTPSINQVENYYNKNKNLYLEPEKRDFIQFNFKNVDEASDFKKNISTFKNDQIIKFAKDKNILFNDFTKVSKNEVLEDLANVIFNLQENQISEVVETPLAKHIVIVSDIHLKKQKTIKQARKEISNTLLDVEINSYISDLKNKISQQILDGLSINEIAKDNILNVLIIKRAERLTNDPSKKDLVQSEVISKGFTTNKDFVSDIIDIDNKRSIIVNVDQIEKSKPYELKEVFEEVSKDWLKSLKIKSLEEKIIEISSSSKSIIDISEFTDVKINNLDIQIDSIGYPSSFKNNIFENVLNQISTTIDVDEIFISKVNKISFPETIENEQSLLMTSELRGSFGAEIIKNKNISTNDNLIQALISQY